MKIFAFLATLALAKNLDRSEGKIIIRSGGMNPLILLLGIDSNAQEVRETDGSQIDDQWLNTETLPKDCCKGWFETS